MSRTNWKRLQPNSLRQALELNKEFARQRHNLSVERIAERMGLPDHFALYKWMQNGRMPTVLIRSFEEVCGIDFVTRWVAASAGKLLIDIPSGKQISAEDLHTLQEVLNEVVGRLIKFYSHKADAPETLGAIQTAMESLAFHRGNVEKHMTPELEFGHE